MVPSLTWALECDRPQRHRSVLLQVLEVDRDEGRRLKRRTRRSKFDEAKFQRSGQQAGSHVKAEETWLTPYKRYLTDGLSPSEPAKAKIVKRNSQRYTLIDGNLFRYGYTQPLLTCVIGDHCTQIISELREGICGNHIAGQALLLKVIRAGYYWLTMKEDCGRYVQRCEQCQKHVDWCHAPAEELRSIYSPWLLHTLGIDILGHFPLAIRQMKYLICHWVLTKWIEVEPVAQITAHKVQHFVWKSIVCRFRIPKHLAYENGTQFSSQQLGKLCTNDVVDFRIVHFMVWHFT